MRRAARRDVMEADIVQALRSVGASVTRINQEGLFDLLVGYRGVTTLVEVKTPSRKDGKAQTRATGTELSVAQQKWLESWRGGPAVVVRSMTDALQAVGAMVPPVATVSAPCETCP